MRSRFVSACRGTAHIAQFVINLLERPLNRVSPESQVAANEAETSGWPQDYRRAATHVHRNVVHKYTGSEEVFRSGSVLKLQQRSICILKSAFLSPLSIYLKKEALTLFLNLSYSLFTCSI